ncbi:MAG: GTP-binding protein [Planctomycetota bacterium]
MTVVKIEGRSLREALERARDEVGEGAVVITRRRGKDRVVLAVSSAAPRDPMDLLNMRQEARNLLRPRRRPTAVPTDAIERCLSARGASASLTRRVCEAVRSRSDKAAHPLDLAGDEIGKLFPVAQARIERGTTAVLAFVGASGAGKTTSIAKLAARLTRAGRRVAMVTLDVYRVGAVEQVRALGRKVGCKTHAAREIQQIGSLLAMSQRPDVILIDATGRPDQDGAALRKFHRLIQGQGWPAQLSVYLIAEATMRPIALEEEIVRLGPLPYAGCVLTKTDETRRPAPVLEYLARKGFGIAFLCNGRDIDQDFYRASGDRFANLLLKGKVN